MDKTKGAIVRAKITYFFKETFRAHSKAEYREIFSRGLNEENEGVTGAFPWLYVRAFFALLILFTVNVLIFRLTKNPLLVPSVIFLGGITFTIPFIILLFELYPKRGVSLFLLMSVLVVGGTAASVLAQVGYLLIPIKSSWGLAVVAGVLEEICKAVPAILAIALFRQKNPYACYLIAAAVGAGFSIIEDMGYIFRYSDMNVALEYNSDVQAILTMFLDRGMSSFCTHIVWTGAVGWSYSLMKRPMRSAGILIFLSSVAMHVCWDLPLDGWLNVLDISLCVIVAAVINITIVHLSRIRTLAEEVDLTYANERIIREAKQMGELLRFRNAGNLTFALSSTLLSVIILILCALPIGTDFKTENYDSVEEFISFVEGGYNLKADWNRKYDPDGDNFEVITRDGEVFYVIQRDTAEGYDGEYYYAYYMSEPQRPFEISVELEDVPSKIPCSEFRFGNKTVWTFDVNMIKGYKYHEIDGSVTAITDAEEFAGYNLLIALCGTACAISIACTVVLVSFKIKLRRVKDER